MKPYILAGVRLRALGYQPAKNSGSWIEPWRLRLIERDMRRRGLHRDAAGIAAMVAASECDRLAIEERCPEKARELLYVAEYHESEARRLLDRSSRPRIYAGKASSANFGCHQTPRRV